MNLTRKADRMTVTCGAALFREDPSMGGGDKLDPSTVKSQINPNLDIPRPFPTSEGLLLKKASKRVMKRLPCAEAIFVHVSDRMYADQRKVFWLYFDKEKASWIVDREMDGVGLLLAEDFSPDPTKIKGWRYWDSKLSKWRKEYELRIVREYRCHDIQHQHQISQTSSHYHKHSQHDYSLHGIQSYDMKDTNGDSHHYPSPHQNSRKKKLKEGGNNCHKHDNISQQPQRRQGARRGGRKVSYSVHSVLKHKQNAGKGRCRTGSSDEYNNVSHGCNRMNSKENNLGAEGKNKIPSSHLTLNTKDHSASKWKKQIPTPSGSKMCANKPCDMAYITTFHGCNVDVGLRLGMGKHTTVGHVYDIATKRILCKNLNLILHRGAGFGGGAWVLKGPPDKFQRAQKLTDIGVHPMRKCALR
eukprot:jgi/Bigna1/136902/aug1.36_g11610